MRYLQFDRLDHRPVEPSHEQAFGVVELKRGTDLAERGRFSPPPAPS